MDSGTLFTLAAYKTCNERNNRLTRFPATLFPGFTVARSLSRGTINDVSRHFHDQLGNLSDATTLSICRPCVRSFVELSAYWIVHV